MAFTARLGSRNGCEPSNRPPPAVCPHLRWTAPRPHAASPHRARTGAHPPATCRRRARTRPHRCKIRPHPRRIGHAGLLPILIGRGQTLRRRAPTPPPAASGTGRRGPRRATTGPHPRRIGLRQAGHPPHRPTIGQPAIRLLRTETILRGGRRATTGQDSLESWAAMAARHRRREDGAAHSRHRRRAGRAVRRRRRRRRRVRRHRARTRKGAAATIRQPHRTGVGPHPPQAPPLRAATGPHLASSALDRSGRRARRCSRTG